MPDKKAGLYAALNPAQQDAFNQAKAAANRNNNESAPAKTSSNFKNPLSGAGGGLFRNKWVKYALLGLAGLATLPIWSYPLATAWGAKKLYQNGSRIVGGLFGGAISTVHAVPRAIWATMKVGAVLTFAYFAGTTAMDLHNDRGGLSDAAGNNAVATARKANKVVAEVAKIAIPATGNVMDSAGDVASSAVDTVGKCADDVEKCAENAFDSAGNLAVKAGQKWLGGWSSFIDGYYGFLGKFAPDLPTLTLTGESSGHHGDAKNTITPPRKPERPVQSIPDPVQGASTKYSSSIREDLLAGGLNVLNSRWVVACTPKVIDDKGHYTAGAAKDLQNGIIAQRLAAADAAVDAQMNDANSPLVRAIRANKKDNVLLKFNHGVLQVTSHGSSTIPIPDGYACHRHDMTDFIGGSGMNPGLQTPVIPHK